MLGRRRARMGSWYTLALETALVRFRAVEDRAARGVDDRVVVGVRARLVGQVPRELRAARRAEQHEPGEVAAGEVRHLADAARAGRDGRAGPAVDVAPQRGQRLGAADRGLDRADGEVGPRRARHGVHAPRAVDRDPQVVVERRDAAVELAEAHDGEPRAVVGRRSTSRPSRSEASRPIAARLARTKSSAMSVRSPARGALSAPSVRRSWRGVPVSGSMFNTPPRPSRSRSELWAREVARVGRAAATVARPARAAWSRASARESKKGFAAPRVAADAPRGRRRHQHPGLRSTSPATPRFVISATLPPNPDPALRRPEKEKPYHNPPPSCCSGAAPRRPRPAMRPENRQPPRKVPSSAR